MSDYECSLVEKMVQPDPELRISTVETRAGLKKLAEVEAYYAQIKCSECQKCSAPLPLTFRFCSNCGEQHDKLASLMDAAQFGFQNIVQMLVDDQVLLDETNNVGKTPLIIAASGGHANAVRILLDAGASVNVVDAKGESAMLHAIKNNYDDDVMEFLRDKIPGWMQWSY